MKFVIAVAFELLLCWISFAIVTGNDVSTNGICLNSEMNNGYMPNSETVNSYNSNSTSLDDKSTNADMLNSRAELTTVETKVLTLKTKCENAYDSQSIKISSKENLA